MIGRITPFTFATPYLFVGREVPAVEEESREAADAPQIDHASLLIPDRSATPTVSRESGVGPARRGVE